MEQPKPRFLEDVRTITVRRCNPAMSQTGKGCLVIETKEAETIAFVVPLSAIPGFRAALDAIEQLATRPKDKRH
jgi:hypothetical protein